MRYLRIKIGELSSTLNYTFLEFFLTLLYFKREKLTDMHNYVLIALGSFLIADC